MSIFKKHLFKKWEVSIMNIQNSGGTKYKVTRRISEMSVAETKIFLQRKKLSNNLKNG